MTIHKLLLEFKGTCNSVTRELLDNIFIMFDIFLELARASINELFVVIHCTTT